MTTENTPQKPLLTPGQKHLLEYSKIPDLIQRFDLHPYSSPEARINAIAHHRVQEIIAQLSGSPQPPKPDFSQYAPLSDDGANKLKDFIRKNKEEKLPKGYCLDPQDKVIFDRDFAKKGILPKELPPQHPDYVPF